MARDARLAARDLEVDAAERDADRRGAHSVRSGDDFPHSYRSAQQDAPAPASAPGVDEPTPGGLMARVARLKEEGLYPGPESGVAIPAPLDASAPLPQPPYAQPVQHPYPSYIAPVAPPAGAQGAPQPGKPQQGGVRGTFRKLFGRR